MPQASARRAERRRRGVILPPPPKYEFSPGFIGGGSNRKEVRRRREAPENDAASIGPEGGTPEAWSNPPPLHQSTSFPLDLLGEDRTEKRFDVGVKRRRTMPQASARRAERRRRGVIFHPSTERCNAGGLGGCRIMAITSAFQADDVGSIPIARSSYAGLHAGIYILMGARFELCPYSSVGRALPW